MRQELQCEPNERIELRADNYFEIRLYGERIVCRIIYGKRFTFKQKFPGNCQGKSSVAVRGHPQVAENREHFENGSFEF